MATFGASFVPRCAGKRTMTLRFRLPVGSAALRFTLAVVSTVFVDCLDEALAIIRGGRT